MTAPLPRRGAALIDDEAARWAVRRSEPAWSAADAAAFERWLAADTAHRVAFLRLDAVWAQAEALRAVADAAPAASCSTPAPTPGPRAEGWAGPPRPALWRAAAAFVLAVALATMAWMQRDGAADTAAMANWIAETPVGAHATHTLADGSRIELNTASRLRTRVDTNVRTAWLDRGEAYFDIAPDVRKPFVVHAAGRTVRVLGTRFLVRLEGDAVRVVVQEGRVRVEEPGRRQPVVELQRGHAAHLRGATVALQTLGDARLEQAFSWRDQLLVFDDTPLAEAAAEFNRYHRRQLRVADPALGALRIGGRFDPAQLDAFTRLLAQGWQLRVDERDGEIRITR